MFFGFLLSLVIAQRLAELQIAKKNSSALLQKGAKEFGASHYWVLVSLHSLFFISLLVEFSLLPHEVSSAWPLWLAIFVLAQLGRVWVIRTMNGRWTTRIFALKGETLVSKGPFAFIPHPNYCLVAVELFTLPMIFNLWRSALLFTLLNAMVLLLIRIPEERKSLTWSQS